ncbi:MAG: proton-conducting transporter membrane subunit [Eubacteriales bacterium]|nr:proton-conducting transporter membrane subunit [Lachnospiraceae bacterium]MDO5127589.1 proton-conducting transporter membrane subunit [Eubacteriales bacterium]
MDFVQNFPFFSIILSLFSGPFSAILEKKWAKRVNYFILFVIGAMSAMVFAYTLETRQAYVYIMGHFPAPWGNEIRFGILEAFMATFFCVIMLLCMVGGERERALEVEDTKQNLYYIMVNLLLCSLLALIYTNDLFTAYVFVEINTISACGLIMIRQNGRTIEAATRYMIMSLLGSGLLLLGICFLYSITGHLLMSNIQVAVHGLMASGLYQRPLMVAICLMAVGLAIKSALFPFHTWLPDAYGYSTVSSAAILSSLVSKGYIFLLVKIFYRVIGSDIIFNSKVIHILFIFGIAGMIMGSIDAIRENDIRRMIAYSSVAQIGYIYMGFGLGTTEGVIASIYHVLSHAATKSLLFITAAGLTDCTNGKRNIHEINGAGYRNKLAGVAFTVGALSMVGVPMFSGFISKLLFSKAAVGHTIKMLPTLIALAISTILNALYFMKTVIRIYSPIKDENAGEEYTCVKFYEQPLKSVAYILFIVLNVVMGLNSEPIIDCIRRGLEIFS